MKKGAKILLWVVVAIVVLYVLRPIFFAGFLFYQARSAQARRVDLLYRTDHATLLKACRKILSEETKGKYNVVIDRHPRVSGFPDAILRLKPTYVRIYDCNYVRVELFGGMSHFGVLAYPVDFIPPFETFDYGDKELVEGLWYYDDGYREDPNFEDYIQSLRPMKR